MFDVVSMIPYVTNIIGYTLIFISIMFIIIGIMTGNMYLAFWSTEFLYIGYLIIKGEIIFVRRFK